MTIAPPADLATPTALYETVRARTAAQLLAIGLLRKPISEQCAWVYEVKVLTASGSVVELDFGARELDLVQARGPENDRDAAALVQRFGGHPAFLTSGSTPVASGRAGGGSGRDAASGSGSSGAGGGSGSGSGGGSDGGDNDGGGSEGGEGGGDSGGGEGGGDSGGGEGGEGGGDSDSGGSEGGEGEDD